MKPDGIVLLRPRQAAQADLILCQQMDWQPLLVEYQHLQPIPTALLALAEESKYYDVIFWTSPSAVNIAAEFVHSYSEQQHVAVGRATALALQKQKFKHIVYPPVGQDSEAVWQLPLWHQQTGKVLLIGGNNGRSWLAEQLNRTGWQVKVAEVYQRKMQCIDWETIIRWQQQTYCKAVYVTTQAAVNHWFQQLPTHLAASVKSLIYLTHHPRVHKALIQYDVQSILVNHLRNGLMLLHTDSK